MGSFQVLTVVILWLGFFGMLEGCKNCPAGEPTRYLPPPQFFPSSFRLARKFPTQYIPNACNKKKPKTKIKINPGQFLEIDRPGGSKIFRAIKLCVKVCKVTSVTAWYAICVWTRPNPLSIQQTVVRTQTIEKNIQGCEKVCFTLPPPPDPPAELPAGVCGQQSLRMIRIRFATKDKWLNKVKVKCVEMKGCLQENCIQL